MNRVTVETNKEGEITMSTGAYAMATTAKEIDDAYHDFHRMLQIGQRENAIKQALGSSSRTLSGCGTISGLIPAKRSTIEIQLRCWW